MRLGPRARGVASVCLCCSLGPSAFQGRGVHPQWAPKLEDLASGYQSVPWCSALLSPQHGPSSKQRTFQMRPWAALFRNLLRPLPTCLLSLLPGCPFPRGAASVPLAIPCGRAGIQPGVGLPTSALCTWGSGFESRGADPRSRIRAFSEAYGKSKSTVAT